MGALIAAQRHSHTHIPFLLGESKPVWHIEAKVVFEPEEGMPVLAALSLPSKVPGYKIFFEQSSSAGYGLTVVDNATHKRAEWSIREASGEQTLFYRIQAIQEETPATSDETSYAPPSQDIVWTNAEELAKEDILKKALIRSSSDETLTRELIKLFASETMSESSSLLLTNKNKEDVINAILNEAGVKSRVSMGLKLEDARRNKSLTPIIEIFDNNKWVLFNAKNAEQNIEKDFFLWQRGGSLIELKGASNAKVSFSMVEQNVPAFELAMERYEESIFGLFSINSLPIEEQSIFKMLLLLPIGALITVFMRLFVGLRTSGTFMPVLIAMAFLQTSLVPGLVTFIMIVAIGLMIRSYLSHLNLLLVSRIATTIIIVIFIIVTASVVGHNLGFNTGMTVAIFPIIILAWTIERMSILWEEDGAKEVLIQGFGSLFVATLAYLAMQSAYVAHLSFNFPELNLIVLALIMLMGRYTGYRLFELYRFREFKEQ
jgi:hypothetical protein